MGDRPFLMQRLEATGGIVRPLVSLEDFFSCDLAARSIGASGTKKFDTATFLPEMVQLRRHPDVHDVKVEIGMPASAHTWPITDTIWVVTRLGRAGLVQDGFSGQFWKHFLPDDWLTFPRIDGRVTEELEIPAGMRALGLWYG